MTTQDVINQGWTEVPCSNLLTPQGGYAPVKVRCAKMGGAMLEGKTLDGQVDIWPTQFCRKPSDLDVLRFRQRELERGQAA